MSLRSLSASEQELLRGYYIPEKALRILEGITHPEYRVMFINGVVNLRLFDNLTPEQIKEHYNNIRPESVIGYSPPGELVGPQQSRNSRKAGPARQIQAHQGRPRDNEGSHTGAALGGMSAQFAGLGLNGNLLPIPYLVHIRANVCYNGRPSEQHRQSPLNRSELRQPPPPHQIPLPWRQIPLSSW